MKEKKERKVTPVGEAKWAHVHEPKAPYRGANGIAKGDPKYQIDVVFDINGPEWGPWAQDIKAKLQALPQQINKKTGEPMRKQTPIKRELDENDEPTGRLYATFKTSAKFKLGVFDEYGRVLPPDKLVGNGSKVRVSYTENQYDGFGGGINFYLNAVQVVDLVEYQAQTASSFGFETKEAPEWDPEPAGEPQPTPPVEAYEDDLPF